MVTTVNGATVIVSVDVDDDIDDTKPAATQHTTECCPFRGIRNKKKIIISNDGNENQSGFVFVVDDDGGGGDKALSVSVDVDD